MKLDGSSEYHASYCFIWARSDIENGICTLIVPISPFAASQSGYSPALIWVFSRYDVLLLVCPTGLGAEGSKGLYGGGVTRGPGHACRLILTFSSADWFSCLTQLVSLIGVMYLHNQGMKNLKEGGLESWQTYLQVSLRLRSWLSAINAWM